jgi:phospholipid/cholesterol/gamma-HCH transport system substrate-binding protein
MIARVAALGALGVVVVAVIVLLLSGGSKYQVRAIFTNASQIVSGDQVEVAGNSIGSVSDISLTPNGQAVLTLSINDSTYRPLHEGTRAIVRQASLSGIANRYVDLNLGPGTAAPIPNNGVIPSAETTAAVDLDQLFNTLDARTRKGLQDVFQGSASQYAGRGKQTQLAWVYLNPVIATSSILFHELNRDTSKFTHFIVNSSHLVTALAQRQSDLSGLVSHLSTTFSALASQQTALGQSIQRLPPFMRLANTTFVNLRNSLTDLTALINASKPNVFPRSGYPNGRLQALLQQLRPLAVESVPTIRNLANLISRPGANNDLIELNNLAPPLAQATVGGEFGVPKVRADGAPRLGAFVVSKKAFQGTNGQPGATQELAIARPYAVDLTGWFEGYSHPGVLDANGGASRVGLIVGLGSTSNGLLNLSPQLLANPGLRQTFAKTALTTGQGDRCPGSMERGPNPGTPAGAGWFPETGYPCDPSQVPTGP